MVTFLALFGGLAILAGAFLAIVSVPLILSMLVAICCTSVASSR